MSQKPRICATCDRPAASQRHRYCYFCRQIAQLRRGVTRNRHRRHLTTAQQGYGAEHKRLRRQVTGIVTAGNAVCARCGVWIHPDEPWDLGHDDNDRSRYTGPEHRACNRATNGRRKAKRALSRAW